MALLLRMATIAELMANILFRNGSFVENVGTSFNGICGIVQQKLPFGAVLAGLGAARKADAV